MVIAAPMLLLAALVEELSGTNDRLRGILASISDCYFAIGADGRIAAMNARAAAWLSDEPAEAMIGRDAADILSGGPVISRHIRRSIKAMASIDIEILSMRHPGRWIELRTFPSTAGVGVFFRDITDRKLARLARHEAHLLLQSTLDALSAHVAILDRSGVIIAVNAAWRRFAWANGLRSTDTGVGSSYLAICDAAAPTCPEAAKLATGLRAIMAGRIRTLRLEYSAHRAGDPPRWFQLRVTRFDEGEAMRLVLAHEDITETWRAADASRKLLGTLLQAQDEERRRIARELHDSTAQTLLGVALTLDRLQKIAPRLSEAALALLSESSGLLAQAQREIRTFSYLLHPPALEEAGLAPALRDYVGGFSRRTGIKVDLEIAPELERLSRETELALYRIAQEALANIHRHSGSATARLRLSYERAENADGRLALVVEDDGADGPAPAHAFSASKPRAAEAAGVGLASMRERLRHLSGWVEIAPRKTGMTVRAVIPLENARQASPSARRQAEALAPEDALP
jgi:signal transduction histidine kinase